MLDEGLDREPGRLDAPAWLGWAAAALYLVLYLAPLGTRPLFTPDESRYAQIPWEMLAGGDWAALRQVGLRYYEKPPLGYWLTAISQYLFGHNYFAVRLPSALSAGGVALALFLLVKRERRDSGRAWAAAIIYLSSIEVFGIGTFAVLDSIFAMFVCFSLIAYYLAASGEGRRRTVWLVLSGVACSAAFLTKGFTALVIPAVTMLAWLPWEGRTRKLLSDWLTPVLSAVAVTLPAAFIIHRANPGFWNYFLWVEHIQRFFDPSGGQHRQGFWFFVPVLLGTAIPWSFFLPLTAMEAGKRAKTDRLTRYCLCWFVMQFLFFSVCGGKLITYILPGFGPFAILVGDALLDSRRTEWLRRSALAGAGTFLAAIAGFLAWLPFSNQHLLRQSLRNDSRVWLLGLSLAAAAFCLYRASRSFARNRPRLSALGWVAMSLAAPAFASFHFLPSMIEDNKSPSRLLEAVVPLTPPDALLLADHVALPSVSWHYRRRDAAFFGGQGELYYGVNYPEAEGRYFPTPDGAGEWLRQALSSGRPVAVCLRDRNFSGLAAVLAEERPVLLRKAVSYTWALYLPGDGSEPPG
ncbi:MAG: phospholipid carrier-dependent glycosyltransferase [Planctomycetes bacterium]|nr:phospholipid carrier-dependent glycosyltransferase [Planctomycetota bacterium]